MWGASFDESQTWYVVFSERRVPRWHLVHWIIHKPFSHCYLVRELPDGNAMLLDPLRWGLAVQITQKNLEEYLTAAAPHATALLSYTADYRRCGDYVPRGLYSCVTILKAVLGLKCLAITPFQLYKSLVQHPHTTVIKPYVPYIQNPTGQAG